MHGRQDCRLHLALGRQERCPDSACAFWEEGGAVVEPGCAFERVRVDIESRPELEAARDEEDRRRVRAALNQVLPPGLHE
jgi:hypothetical protein